MCALALCWLKEHYVYTECSCLDARKTKQCILCPQNDHMLSHQKRHDAFCADRTSTGIGSEKVLQWFNPNIGVFSFDDFQADALQMRLRSIVNPSCLSGRFPSTDFGTVTTTRYAAILTLLKHRGFILLLSVTL